MKLYHYDKGTKEFTSETEASINPLEKNKFLIPANATKVAPLASKKGYSQIFDEITKRWKYIKDSRGSLVYNILNKESKIINYLGDIEQDFTELVPKNYDKWEGAKWVTDLSLVKVHKISNLNNLCKKDILSGFTSNALGSVYHYQSEQVDQLNLIGMVAGGVDDYFKCSLDDGSGNTTTWEYKLHTITQLKQVLNDGKAYKLSLLQKVNTLKAQANSATTKTALGKIAW
ncbi:MAG: hypothetical protein GXP61_08010 [Epsilonproteobacteria bacterium]|nr:hypothetical protein [Campylobacterota bacterium]